MFIGNKYTQKHEYASVCFTYSSVQLIVEFITFFFFFLTTAIEAAVVLCCALRINSELPRHIQLIILVRG